MRTLDKLVPSTKETERLMKSIMSILIAIVIFLLSCGSAYAPLAVRKVRTFPMIRIEFYPKTGNTPDSYEFVLVTYQRETFEAAY